jgi:conjugative transfer region protein TrbK
MNASLNPQQLLRIVAVGSVALAAAVAIIQSRRGEDAAVLTPLELGEADAFVSELARCRTITPDDAAALEACRRLWAENRQHFFLSKKSPPPPVALAPEAAAEPAKNQVRGSLDGIEQGRAR